MLAASPQRLKAFSIGRNVFFLGISPPPGLPPWQRLSPDSHPLPSLGRRVAANSWELPLHPGSCLPILKPFTIHLKLLGDFFFFCSYRFWTSYNFVVYLAVSCCLGESESLFQHSGFWGKQNVSLAFHLVYILQGKCASFTQPSFITVLLQASY